MLKNYGYNSMDDSRLTKQIFNKLNKHKNKMIWLRKIEKTNSDLPFKKLYYRRERKSTSSPNKEGPGKSKWEKNTCWKWKLHGQSVLSKRNNEKKDKKMNYHYICTFYLQCQTFLHSLELFGNLMKLYWVFLLKLVGCSHLMSGSY